MLRYFFLLPFFCFVVFAAAEENRSANPRLLFNHGAKLAADGKFDEAAEVLRQTAAVRDKTIAARSLSLLGQIAAGSAKQLLADPPIETPSEERQKILDHLASAEKSFSESLTLEPNDEIRTNLEALRTWRDNMANAWSDYDQEQFRNGELQQRLQWLTNWEENLTERIRQTADVADSPQKMQTNYEAGKQQKQLADELSLLQNAPVEEELKEKWTHLPVIQKVADEASKLLLNHQQEDALPKQQQVLDYLRTLLKPQQNEQNQNQQEQKEQNQEQKEQQQSQNQQQQSEPQKQEKAENAQNDSQQKEEDAKEKAERMLMQVRRKQQAADKRREEIKAMLMQSEPVEKDW